MTLTYQQSEQDLQQRTTIGAYLQGLIAKNPEKFGAAISTSFATITMTVFLWSQIVLSLIQRTV